MLIINNNIIIIITISQGIRVDNCHTTPVHVGAWMMAEARVIRPDLYVIAELVTNKLDVETTYTNQLGLNAIILNTFNISDISQLGEAILKYSKSIF